MRRHQAARTRPKVHASQREGFHVWSVMGQSHYAIIVRGWCRYVGTGGLSGFVAACSAACEPLGAVAGKKSVPADLRALSAGRHHE
jgi:hypothetical protein